jgi:DNA-binding transcriptional LysR family regulator
MNDSTQEHRPNQTSSPAPDLKQLRYVVTAASHGSFRSAAEALQIRQSTLSRAVRQLEDAIGMVVFDRSSGGISPTESGRSFLRVAGSILEQLDSLAMSTRMIGRGEAGRLAIGFYTSLSTGNLRAAVTDHAKRFPRVEIALLETSKKHLDTALRNGLVDIVIVTGDRGFPETGWMPLWSERILVALPEGHRLAANTIVYWTDLKEETVLLGRRDPGPAIEELLTAKIALPEDRPRIFSYDVSRESIKSLVGASFGVGLTLEASLGATFDGVVHREIQDGSGPARLGVSASWMPDNENPALTVFLKLLRERYPSPAV